MKVAIPVDVQSLDGAVAENFGRAANFLFYDTETKSVDYLDNSAVMSAGGCGRWRRGADRAALRRKCGAGAGGGWGEALPVCRRHGAGKSGRVCCWSA